MTSEVSRPAFWEGLYQAKDDGWEVGEPAPPLVRILSGEPPAPTGGKVAVIGCGRGHDARLFARHGYQVWGFDFTEYAIREARRLAEEEGLDVHFEERDVFRLPDEYTGSFDLVWEYTSYCAIDPARRDEYISAIREIIAPEGALLALFYPVREGTDGPPFPTTEEEIRDRIGREFLIDTMVTPVDSLPRRQGKERLVRAVPL